MEPLRPSEGAGRALAWKKQHGPLMYLGGPQKELGGPHRKLGGPQRELGGPQRELGGTWSQLKGLRASWGLSELAGGPPVGGRGA